MIGYRRRGATYFIRGTVKLGRDRLRIPERAIDAASDDEAQAISERVFTVAQDGLLRGDGVSLINYRIGRVRGIRGGQELPTRVYGIWAERLDLVKFGIAQDVPRRLSAILVGSPDVLHLVMDIPGDIELERELHFRFRGSRVRGEWFQLSDDVLGFLATTANADPMPDGLEARLRSHRSNASTFAPGQGSTTLQSP